MRKSIAEAYCYSLLCPICQFTCSMEDEQAMYDHMIANHSDAEMIELTGWDIKDYEEDGTE